jgi:hypothetical protein
MSMSNFQLEERSEVKKVKTKKITIIRKKRMRDGSVNIEKSQMFGVTLS